MLIRLDPARGEPIYDQLASSIRGAIARGELSEGDRLPAARELADSLSINVHTVLRGYQQLRDEGLVELRRGRGAVVTAAAFEGRARLVAAARALRAEGRRLGLTTDELLDMIREGY